MRKVLVTGGAGYIGSHMVRLLLERGYAPVVFDNLSTGHRSFLPREVPFLKGDLRRPADISAAFKKHRVSAAVHFAAAIVVPESVSDPLKYYDNNVTGTLNLLAAMQAAKVKDIVFSSSACVYGEPRGGAIRERAPLMPVNPYGVTKVMVEQILADMARAGRIKYVALRYFNVAGAHPDGGIGILMDAPTHLIPNVMRAAAGRLKELAIFGDDYPTRDGTCVRDYIHVVDLCEAHLLALKALASGKMAAGAVNLGSGRGFSVREVIRTAEQVTGRRVPARVVPRRPGDCMSVVASNALARKLLGWAPRHTLKDIIASAWAWEQAHAR